MTRLETWGSPLPCWIRYVLPDVHTLLALQVGEVVDLEKLQDLVEEGRTLVNGVQVKFLYCLVYYNLYSVLVSG